MAETNRKKETAKIISQEKIGEGIYSMWIACEAAKTAKAGQFISVYTKDASKLLPRPISICEIDSKAGKLRIVYRIAGEGTKQFSAYQAGDDIEILGPLGNGFPLKGKKAFLIGGGIGIPPMVGLLESLSETGCECQVIAGYRDELFLTEEIEKYGKLYIATEDGSAGTKGNVMNAIEENNLSADIIFACGPKMMLKAVKAYAEEKGIECYISLEERMACGIGACLACVCQSKEVDSHSHVYNKRICKDGPVFLSTEVEL